MSLETKTKKELVQIINDMKNKLLELRDVEVKATSEESDLNNVGFSVLCDETGGFNLISLGFSLEKNSACVKSVDKLNTNSIAVATMLAKKFLIEKVLTREQMRSISKGEKI